MKDLSLHVLDVAHNSIAAGAAGLHLEVTEENGLCTLVLTDDGPGIPPRLLASVTDPFTTTRTTRKVGMGLPLLRHAAEQTGGSLTVASRPGEGTKVTAVFCSQHIDCPPLGDMAEAVSLLIQGAPHMEISYVQRSHGHTVRFDTRELREVLGPEISLAEPEVSLWIRDYIQSLAELPAQREHCKDPKNPKLGEIGL